MAKDRLPELQKIQKDMHDTEEGRNPGLTETDEMYFCPLDKKCVELGLLLQSIGLLQENVSNLREQVNCAKKLQDQIEKSLFGVCLQKSQLKKAEDDITAMALNIQGQLNQLFPFHDDPLSVKYRVRISHHKALSKDYLKIMADFHNSQEQHSKHIKSRLQRHLSILGEHNVSDERLEALMQGDVQKEMYAQLQEKEQKYTAICERHDQIKTLEQGVLEVHNLFLDMHNLLMDQSELVDTIEYNVSQTQDYVESASTSLDLAVPRSQDLKKATPYKKKYGVRKYILFPLSLFKFWHFKLSK
ncbi:syntaxin [Lingula anatina]|uniref:Syntaxin n=1 Tax=Lingula anatina TaxID=7574 RepID=A0A1S3HVJ1_LINAN|nr:syntaxin [Lingula anatina]|eukprot:XP_013390055.1 syntaxin [Lingula anatina]